jgi:deoxyribose-phosphate aldolase
MNIIEYGYYDIASNENETKENISKSLYYNPTVISVFPYYVKAIKPLLKNQIPISTILDYPFGLSDSDSRYKLIENAIQNGTDIIEMVAPSNILCNRKYDKFRKELEAQTELCKRSSVDLRYVLEYKIFVPELLYKMASILTEFGINTIYPSANFLMDNISDNILAAMLISQKNTNMNIIVNGSAWTDDQINNILNSTKIYGYKTSNIYTLEKITKKSQNYH